MGAADKSAAPPAGSGDLRDELHHAAREYHGFVHGLDDHEVAARAFRARLARLAALGAPALDALEQQLTQSDGAARDVAARMLSGMNHPEAAARLLAAFLRHDLPPLDGRHVVRLGKASAVAASMFPSLEQVRPFERRALVRALFRRRSPEAEHLIEPIFAGVESLLAEAVIEGMAGWGEPSWLRDVVARPPMSAPKTLPRVFHPLDVRPLAAYHLALTGDRSALDALLAWSRDRSRVRAGHAVLRLAWLAHPDGVAPTARLLRGSRGEALELAVDAAEVYRSPALMPVLFTLVDRPGWLAAEISPESPQAGVLTAVAGIADPEVAEPPSLLRLRPLAEALDPARRFSRGAPLTLVALAEDLTSRHPGPQTAAAHNLRAVTGEDHGFDLEDDLAGNLAAIDAWRARARDPAPMGQGGWAFLGQPLPPPPPLPAP